MSILLSDLVTELQGKVPARNGVPSAAQYQKAVKDAVFDFSRKCSREKLGTLTIVSGTASYALPTDFMRLIGLYYPAPSDGVIVTPGGLVPISPFGLASMSYEKYTFANGQITIYPIPNYSLARTMRYAAGWALSGGTTYADMTEMEAAIVMLKAQCEAMTLQVNAESGGIINYSIGDESFSKAGGTQLASQRDALLGQYQQASADYNGTQTLYGEYFS